MSEFDTEPAMQNGNVLTQFTVTFTPVVAANIGIVDYEGTAIDLVAVISVLRDEVGHVVAPAKEEE